MLNNIMWYYVISYESIWYVVSKKLGNQLQQIQLLTVVWNIIFPIELAMNAMNWIVSTECRWVWSFESEVSSWRSLHELSQVSWLKRICQAWMKVDLWTLRWACAFLSGKWSPLSGCNLLIAATWITQRERKPTDYGMVFYQKITKRIAKASKVSKPNTWILRNHRHETVFFNTIWTTGPLDTQVGLSLQQLGVVINFNFNCILNVFFFAQRVTP